MYITFAFIPTAAGEDQFLQPQFDFHLVIYSFKDIIQASSLSLLFLLWNQGYQILLQNLKEVA